MFRIEYIEHLYGLGIIPIIALIFYALWIRRKKTIQSFGKTELIHRLSANFSRSRVWIKFFALVISIAFIVIAWANPQFGGRKEKVQAMSSDVFIALDISNSMLAEDISPSRLERAKRFTSRLIRSMKGERIGLIFFAGSAYLQMPLTHDYAAAELFVNTANVEQAGTQGTSFSNAIELAQNAFEPDQETQKALIFISDGEDHEEEAMAAAENLKSNSIIIYTIGVGTEEGAYIPEQGRGNNGYKVDDQGNLVLSKVNLSFMADIAEITGGKFYVINNERQVIEGINSEIDRLQKKEVEQKSFTDFTSYYQYFLIAGILFLLLEYLIPSNKKVLIT